ncbi:hypothetical protein DQ04_01441000 [Trypanosoma grayi]|uniref:hypothetical protein n=1 Tax=Trypanosoma grayi TaxID=71804 RepID=UPI0004F44115|nr:hypothetical protein DQ04_01441000 [Trypanosoma grayi]KEG12754.1 hypothetical protein DQ04_01441000 [Trypanosoma grayi]
MSWWSSLSKQLLLQLSRHPAVNNYARQGMGYVTNHPSARRAAAAMTNSWGEMRKRVGSSIPTFKSPGTRNSKTGTEYAAQVTGMWNKYKGRVFSFIAVNFMGIILFFQFGSAIWPMVKQLFLSLFVGQEKKVVKSEVTFPSVKALITDTEDIEKKPKQGLSHRLDEGEASKDLPMERFSVSFSDGSNAHVQQSMQVLEHDVFGTTEKPDFSEGFVYRMNEDDGFKAFESHDTVREHSL